MRPRQTPTFEQVPSYEYTDGPEAARLAARYFGEPLPWQQHVLDVLCARDGRDKYVAKTFCLSAPRQNGKSWDIRARCLYGALADGEKILYTCQHGDTADEMFRALSAPFEDEDNAELHELLEAVRKTNGQQAIWLRNGGMIRFTTRTDSLARGKTYDVLIYDEAQELTRGQRNASKPSISAGPLHNPQTIYLATPPEPEARGDIFGKLHDDVHEGKRPNVAWMEWAVTQLPESNYDRAAWYETNPSLGTVLDLAAVEGEADDMDAPDFAHERLGMFSPKGTATARYLVDQADWDACEIADEDAPDDGKLAFGVKFTTDGRAAAICACLAQQDGTAYVELVDVVDTSRGVNGLAGWLAQRKGEYSAVLIDGIKKADVLRVKLADLKVPRRAVPPCSTADVIGAASMLVDAIQAGELSHIEDEALGGSVCGSVERAIGTKGGFGFGDGPLSQSVQAESAALALYAARTSKRNPRRRGQVRC